MRVQESIIEGVEEIKPSVWVFVARVEGVSLDPDKVSDEGAGYEGEGEGYFALIRIQRLYPGIQAKVASQIFYKFLGFGAVSFEFLGKRSLLSDVPLINRLRECCSGISSSTSSSSSTCRWGSGAWAWRRVSPPEGPGARSVESRGGACKGYGASRHSRFRWANVELIDLVDNGFC